MAHHYLVTGGAGFIGSNYVERLLKRGESVTIYDNLARAGAPLNIQWLQGRFGKDSFRLVEGDIRDGTLLSSVVCNADTIIHLAAQVAVTTSVLQPRQDFEINALGTLNVLEAARLSGRNPSIVYASTNKVYGNMDEVPVSEGPTAYRYANLPNGVPETQPLDFHSPYGCSKGAGDQYMRDYHRIYEIPTVVLRQSCIYGPRQFGVEDQGWVAWFIIAAITGKPITIYGDGKQVRDILFITDLLDAYDAALERIDQTAGKIYNIGGGSANTISIWQEFVPILENLLGRKINTSWSNWRPGDQRVFVADTRKAGRELKFTPKVNVSEGIQRLYRWVNENRRLFS